MCNFAILRHIFLRFYLQNGKIFLLQRGGQKNSQDKGVNKVFGRRGFLDFTLQEGGNGTLPPMPTHVYIPTFPFVCSSFIMCSNLNGCTPKQLIYWSLPNL